MPAARPAPPQAQPSEDNPRAFKHLLSPAVVAALADRLAAHHPGFDRPTFDRLIAPLPTLELKARVELVAEALEPALGLPFPEAAALLVRALPDPADPERPGSGAFWAWPLVRYVGRFGLSNFEASMAAFHALTQRMSAEFDVRPFILAAPERTFATLYAWTHDPSEHVRRLTSETTRTRLPWGLRLHPLIADPRPILPILEALKDDPSPYVRRSVANNLNDLAKDHPDLVITLARRWLAKASRRPLVERALRSLVKAGHPEALAALGHHPAELELVAFDVPPAVAIGDPLTLAVTLHNRGDEPASLVVDFAVRYLGPRGLRAPKVFKWRTTTLAAGATLALDKRHPMKPVSIRALFPGEHEVALQVNGETLASRTFTLHPATSR